MNETHIVIRSKAETKTIIMLPDSIELPPRIANAATNCLRSAEVVIAIRIGSLIYQSYNGGHVEILLISIALQFPMLYMVIRASIGSRDIRLVFSTTFLLVTVLFLLTEFSWIVGMLYVALQTRHETWTSVGLDALLLSSFIYNLSKLFVYRIRL